MDIATGSCHRSRHGPAEASEDWSLLPAELLAHRAVIAMPAWVVAMAYGLTLNQARRLQVAVGEVLSAGGAAR